MGFLRKMEIKKMKTTILVDDTTRDKLKEFKEYVMEDVSMNDFLNWLVNSNPKYMQFIQNERKKKLMEEFIQVNQVNPNISWDDFLKQKVKNEDKGRN